MKSTKSFFPAYGDRRFCAILSANSFSLSTSVAPTTTSDVFGVFDLSDLNDVGAGGIVSIVDEWLIMELL